MGGPEFIVAIVAIVCFSSLIKTWMNKKDNEGPDEESFNRLAQAFMQHKKEMEERVQNLEAIIAEEEKEKNNYSQIEASDSDGSLTNDLQDKDKVRS